MFKKLKGKGILLDLAFIKATGPRLAAYAGGYDMRHVDLSGADLTGADLSCVWMTGCNLRGSVLTGADLTGALMNAADLTGADLTGVDLTGVDLSGGFQRGSADLTNAKLSGTILRNAKYDLDTKWPEGFDPRAAGAVLVHDKRADKPSTTTAPDVKRRRKIPLSIRHQVFRRDGDRCKRCGRSATDGVTLEIDHIVPVATGGSDDISNLRLLCFECNRGKSDRMD